MYLGDQALFSGDNSAWDDSWEPPKPEPDSTIWRYMSFAKFCSLMERRALFFALVGDMEDKYEGFICPPPRKTEAQRQQAEQLGRQVLHKIVRSSLINCWTLGDYESTHMWKSYAGKEKEGVAIRSTLQGLQESIRLANTELPILYGKVEYVDYRQQEVPRFKLAPLFHNRQEFRGEEEVRAVLPGSRWNTQPSQSRQLKPDVDILLDEDIAEQGGRYISVDLSIMVKEVVVSPLSASWFVRLVESVVTRSAVNADVKLSTLGNSPDDLDGETIT